MRVFLNNWSTPLLNDLSGGVLSVSTTAAQALKSAIDSAPPDAQTYLTLDDGVQQEIVRVTGVDVDLGRIYIVRAQEGTSALTWNPSTTTVSLRVTAGYLNDLHNAIISRIATNGTEVLIGANGEVLSH